MGGGDLEGGSEHRVPQGELTAPPPTSAGNLVVLKMGTG